MTITILENPKDTYIKESDTDENFGLDSEVKIGGDWSNGLDRSGLMKFDLSSIPVGATINSAILSLYFHSEQDEADFSVYFHRGLVQWYEGRKDGDPPGATNGSTWDQRNANTGAPLAWVGGAGGGSGSDYVAAVTDEDLIEGVGKRYEFDLTADVAGIIAGTYVNHGWFLLGDSGYRRGKFFYSKEASDPDKLPEFTIDHEGGGTGPEPPAGVAGCCVSKDERGP